MYRHEFYLPVFVNSLADTGSEVTAEELQQALAETVIRLATQADYQQQMQYVGGQAIYPYSCPSCGLSHELEAVYVVKVSLEQTADPAKEPVVLGDICKTFRPGSVSQVQCLNCNYHNSLHKFSTAKKPDSQSSLQNPEKFPRAF